MAMFAQKRIKQYKPFLLNTRGFKSLNSTQKKVEEINEVKIDTVMTTAEKINAMNDAMAMETSFKKIKKDKGLIERTESSKTILTEDNKELLKD